MKKFIVLGCLLLSAFTSGCVGPQIRANLEPGQYLKDLGKTYVAHFEPDKRNLNEIIAQEITLMGYKATTGERADMPADTQTLVTYEDHWMWDMSMYLLRINISFVDAKTDKTIISGETIRPSLIRREPPVMIRETLQEMLSKKS